MAQKRNRKKHPHGTLFRNMRPCPRCSVPMGFGDQSQSFPLCVRCVEAVGKPGASDDYRVRILRRELGDGYTLRRTGDRYLLTEGDRLIAGPTLLDVITLYVLRYRWPVQETQSSGETSVTAKQRLRRSPTKINLLKEGIYERENNWGTFPSFRR